MIKKRYISSIIFILYTGFLFGQDQVIFLKGDMKYVDKVDSIYNDTIYYTSFKKHYKEPLTKIKGYYLTIQTKENQKKRFYKRERIYYAVDPSFHKNEEKTKIQTDYASEYVNSRIPKDLSSLNYFTGFYISNKYDTTSCEIAELKKQSDNYLLCIIRLDSAKYQILNGAQINEYSVNNDIYKSYILPSDTESKRYVFVKQVIKGRMNLYQKASFPFDKERYYLLNICNTGLYYQISQGSTNEIIVTSSDLKMIVRPSEYQNPGVIQISYQDANLNNSFKEIMPNLISDCLSLTNKVKSEFYTKADIVQIVKEYNRCK